MTPEVVLVYTEMDIGSMDPAHRLIFPTYARYSYIYDNYNSYFTRGAMLI